MLRLTLRQLEVFVAIARRENVTQAAAAIGLSQSAASAALAELETQLGSRLFDRFGKRLVLNAHGREVLAHADGLLDRARELETLATGEAIELRLAASTTIGKYLLPAQIGHCLTRWPGSRFTLQVSNTEHVIDAVARGEVDAGFVEGHCAHPQIEAQHWRDDELCVCVAPSHPLAALAAPTPADLAAADWVLREPGSGTREVAEHALSSALGPIRLVLELGDSEAIKRLLESGFGVSCLSRLALAEALQRGTLCVLNTPWLALQRPFHLLLHRAGFRSRGLQRFLAAGPAAP
ncbi:LysR family transcriptional regulator [Plasticicumulans acidivorans]|uniref:LysR family transcriptional regulator n=1 Tax=Plasticicumulans acidivorans TaxID=886464 RepID=A0A317MT99_9GAMM|nr:LysR family transcriptional regulator [Plasticicumulans acidivorans]PWV60152.1 LysR family transcriptional regulator [Plasticicumulans acidivorans]